MEDERREEEMMEYLRAHPKKAKRLMKEARRRSIAELEAEYSDVIVAYSETKTLLDGIVAGLVAVKEAHPLGERSKEFAQANEDGEKEWNRLCYEFHVAHGHRYDAYERELAIIEDGHKKLRALLLV